MNSETNHQAQNLEEAFQLFNQLSEQLASSYHMLEGRVAQLNDELALARSERMAQQEMLNRYKRLSAMGEVAAGLAHQIRTPLASALLYVNQLSRPDLKDADRQRFVGKVLSRLHHLDRMVNDMLVFARGGEMSDEDITIDSLFTDLAHVMEPQLQARAGSMEFINKATGATLRGNREALLGALTNISTNAVQASDGSPHVRVTAHITNDDHVQISICDNGRGIPDTIKEKIFEPFFTTRKDGTGLGLSVVQAVVTAHRGEVTVHSPANQGTTFTIRLPKTAADSVLPSGAFSGSRNNKAPKRRNAVI